MVAKNKSTTLIELYGKRRWNHICRNDTVGINKSRFPYAVSSFILSLLFLNIILTRSTNGLLFDIDKWSFTKKYYRHRLHLIVRLCYRMICELRESVSIEERGHLIQLHWQKFRRMCIVY